MVIPQVLDENRSLILIFSRFLQIFSKANGYDKNTIDMIAYKISFSEGSLSILTKARLNDLY